MPAIAENLYAAISTDNRFVSLFEYNGAYVRDRRRNLVRCGVDVGRISQLLYENFPRRRIELLRELLGTMHFGCDGKLGLVSV